MLSRLRSAWRENPRWLTSTSLCSMAAAAVRLPPRTCRKGTNTWGSPCPPGKQAAPAEEGGTGGVGLSSRAASPLRPQVCFWLFNAFLGGNLGMGNFAFGQDSALLAGGVVVCMGLSVWRNALQRQPLSRTERVLMSLPDAATGGRSPILRLQLTGPAAACPPPRPRPPPQQSQQQQQQQAPRVAQPPLADARPESAPSSRSPAAAGRASLAAAAAALQRTSVRTESV